MYPNVAFKCVQALLIGIQLFGLIGCVYYTIYVILLLANEEQGKYFSGLYLSCYLKV
jgi:hypothetical protein